ncbi:MAG: Fic family protein [bacterium]|nr:Fic family protein [bacterium]
MVVIFFYLEVFQMIFSTPKLTQEEDEVLGKVRDLWSQLRFILKSGPHRWTGFLRRSALARGIRGSNSIEGHNVSDDDALAAVDQDDPFEAEVADWRAVTGYRNAMTYVLRVADDPHTTIDASLIRSLHFMMIGHDIEKLPGSWRPGAIFVRKEETGDVVYEGPPAELVPGLIGELLDSIASDSHSSWLVEAAMAHLNLAMIHPFKDGNGRMARCLQTLVMARVGVYDPIFCSVEEYLGRNTPDYYAVLEEVGQGRWQPSRSAHPWIRFMLTAHFRQATTFLRRQQEVSGVWGDIEELLAAEKLPDRATASLVEAAFGHRIRNNRYCDHADVPSQTASRDLKALVKNGLLEPIGVRRGRRYQAGEKVREIRNRHRFKKPVPTPFE